MLYFFSKNVFFIFLCYNNFENDNYNKGENMIEAGIIAWVITGAVRTEILKSKQLELTNEIKEKIANEGIYHITSKEAAEQIVQSGYFLPSKGIVNNHFTKSRYGDDFADLVYMFAGKPSKQLFNFNIGDKLSPDGTVYAVKHKPNKYELNNYKERLEDGALTYEGRLDISNSEPELVRMKWEKDNLVEIPWDEPVKNSIKNQIKSLPIIKSFAGVPDAFKSINKNVRFKDKEGKLKRSIEIEKERQKMLEQYNNDTQVKNITIEKDGMQYIVSTMGTKINDGKALTGFRISREEDDFAKNVFTDAMDINSVSEEHLSTFLSDYMNENSVSSEYIGKPVVKDGEIHQEKDEEYSHHFYAKQLMVVKNDATYASYVKEEEDKKQSQMKALGNIFKSVSPSMRKEATNMIQTAKTKGLEIKQKIEEFIKDESGSLSLGG